MMLLNNEFIKASIVAQTSGLAEQTYKSISTDTRRQLEGTLFVALRGDNFDSHQFISDAIHAGAGGVILSQWQPSYEKYQNQVTFFVVENTLTALQQLGLKYRQVWNKTVIGITGSNGKTTVKDFTHQILSTKVKTLKSIGSFNNHWGVPLTLMNLQANDEVAVVEMGMSQLGEIEQLCDISEPEIVLVNNVGRAHLGPLKTIENVAKAKQEIYQADSAKIAIFNLSNSWTKDMYQRCEGYRFKETLTYGTLESDVYYRTVNTDGMHTDIECFIKGETFEVRVQLSGSHNIENLMAASCCAIAVGFSSDDIRQALPSCATGWGRNQWLKLPDETSVLFDAYNANPESFSALLKSLPTLPCEKKYLVCGEMLEQGSETEEVHRGLAQQLVSLVQSGEVNGVTFIGASSGLIKHTFNEAGLLDSLIISDTYNQRLAIEIKNMLNPSDLLIVKGSRGQQLERLVCDLGLKNFKKRDS